MADPTVVVRLLLTYLLLQHLLLQLAYFDIPDVPLPVLVESHVIPDRIWYLEKFGFSEPKGRGGGRITLLSARGG